MYNPSGQRPPESPTKIHFLRHTQGGKRIYWPESLSGAEAVGVAAKLEEPELVSFTFSNPDDLVHLLSSLRSASAVQVVTI